MYVTVSEMWEVPKTGDSDKAYPESVWINIHRTQTSDDKRKVRTASSHFTYDSYRPCS